MGYSKLDKISREEFENIIAQSHTQREALRMFGYMHSGNNTRKILARKLEEYNIDTSHWDTNNPTSQYTYQEIFIQNSNVSNTTLRHAVLSLPSIPYRCAVCQQPPIYMGKELVLRLDHINGVNNDNRLENLRWICPNCDSQQQTYCGRNVTHEKDK